MDSVPTDISESRFVVRPTSDSHFSWLRTRMSLERTLMSWVRTAVSLIGFGFTIVQFFERLPGMAGTAPARFPEAPRYFGLLLIFCGVAALAISAWEYRISMRYLWSDDYAVLAGTGGKPMWTPLFATTLALALVGSATFLSLFFRLA